MIVQDPTSQNSGPSRPHNFLRNDTNRMNHPGRATSTFGYTTTIVAYTFHSSRRIFSVAFGVIIVWFLSWMVASQFFARPMCSLPIVSPMIPSCHSGAFKRPQTHTSARRPARLVDYPKFVDFQARTVDQLLDKSAGKTDLALEIKKTEIASNDLIIFVRASDLKSKDQISIRLSGFSEEARGAGRSLHSLGEKIQGAVDSIAILNDYAIRTIEASKSPSLVTRLLFSLSSRSPTEEAVIEMFHMLMDDTSSHLARLREEAETSIGHLLRLEEKLMVLHEVTHRDARNLKVQREAADQFFEWLGFKIRINPDATRKIDLDLDLLKNVENYKRKALAHVTVILETLHTLDADMEELRARMAAPDIVGDKIPLEVHIMNIKAGVDRLKEGQVRASLRYASNVDKVLETST